MLIWVRIGTCAIYVLKLHANEMKCLHVRINHHSHSNHKRFLGK